MTNVRAIFCFTFLMLTSACNQQQNNRAILGQAYAEKELKSALTDRTQHNVIDNKTAIIKDSITAIRVAEPILFSIYGKDNITQQRPYEAYFIDNYWVISGTLPKNYAGGTFLILIDARNSRIVRITHGK